MELELNNTNAYDDEETDCKTLYTNTHTRRLTNTKTRRPVGQLPMTKRPTP